MRFSVLLAGSIASFALAGPVFADDAALCADGAGDAKIAACTNAIQSGKWAGPNLAWAFTNRGYAHYDKGDPDRAIADYTQALRLDPKSAFAYTGRGHAFRGSFRNDPPLKRN